MTSVRLAEIAPSVGRKIDIMVLKPSSAGDGTYVIQLLAQGGMIELERHYKKFGPRATKHIPNPGAQLIDIEKDPPPDVAVVPKP